MRRLLSCRKGATAVEFAMIAPVFLMMLLGIIEFAFQMWTRVSLDYAIAQAARCYAIGYVDAGAGIDCSSLSGTKADLQKLAIGVQFPTGALTLSSPSGGCLHYSYAAQWLMPRLMPVNAPTFTNMSCYYF
jgi:Flp pilus assembly pilin Flp